MKYRYRLHPIGYTLGENEKFYSDMEAKGWRVVKRGTYLSKFVRSEPAASRYRIEVVPLGFQEDGCTMPPEQRAVYEDCGWEYVLGWNQLHLFRAPEGSEAPEFYVDPAEQLPAIEALSKLNWWGWQAIWVVVFGRSFFVRNGASGIKGALYDWYMSWVEQPAAVGLYALFLLWMLYLTLRQTWYVKRTCRNLKNGIPLDHNPQQRHTVHQVICGALLAMAVLCCVLMAAQAVGSREQPLPEQADGPYLLMDDLGWGHRGSSTNTIRRFRTPQVDWWEVHESSGLPDLWMRQKVYRMGSPGAARRVAAALRETSRGYSFRPDECYIYTTGELDAWICDYSLVAVQGRMAAFIYYGGNGDPEELLAVLADRWTAYTEEGAG